MMSALLFITELLSGMLMNIYTPAGGIFGTHVTWNDIEEDMQRELDTVATFGLNKTAKSIGDLRGFMSMILLIDPDWQHKDKELPDNFVVKIVSQLVMQRLAAELSKENNTANVFDSKEVKMVVEAQQKRVHNAEVTVYNHISKLPAGKMASTKIYASKKFTEFNPVKGYLVMEYFDGLKPVQIYENVPKETLKDTLRAKAVLEAMSLKFTPEETKEFTQNIFTEFIAQLLREDFMGTTFDIMRASTSERLTEKINKVEQAYSQFMDFKRADELADEMGMRRVLCHGDLWSNNMLWKQEHGKLSVIAMIDYQNAHMGCPASDLVRLFSSCLSGKDRRSHWEELLEEFYGYLEEEVGDMEMPYSLEQLKESYRRFMPIGGFLLVRSIAPLFEKHCRSKHEESKKKGLDAVMEKTECLLDDILYYHNRNERLK